MTSPKLLKLSEADLARPGQDLVFHLIRGEEVLLELPDGRLLRVKSQAVSPPATHLSLDMSYGETWHKMDAVAPVYPEIADEQG